MISSSQLLAVGTRSESKIVTATLVDNHTTQPRLEGAASALEDCQPTADLTERVVDGITDVEPEELSAVVVRIVIKGGSGDVGADLLNRFLIHIGVEDVCGLVRGGVVGGVADPAVSRLTCIHLEERIHLRVSTAIGGGVGETRNLEINQVVVSTEATINTEGLNEFARRSIADVLTEFAIVTEERTAGLRAGDQTEDSGTILTTKWVVTCAITDKLDADDIKLILRELEGRNRNATNAVEVGVFGAVTALDLRNEAQILATAAVVENRLGKLSKLLHSLSDLRLNLEAGLQIVQADARGLVALGLEVPVLNSLTESQIVSARNATIGGSTIGGADIRPVVFDGARKNTLNGDLV